MRAAYAVTLTVGALALLAWMIAHGVARNTDRPDRDPEERFGTTGRRIVAGAVGFGMAGMSAEFAAIEIPPLAVLGLAVAGAAGAAVWAGFAGDDSEEAG